MPFKTMYLSVDRLRLPANLPARMPACRPTCLAALLKGWGGLDPGQLPSLPLLHSG